MWMLLLAVLNPILHVIVISLLYFHIKTGEADHQHIMMLHSISNQSDINQLQHQKQFQFSPPMLLNLPLYYLAPNQQLHHIPLLNKNLLLCFSKHYLQLPYSSTPLNLQYLQAHQHITLTFYTISIGLTSHGYVLTTLCTASH